MAATIKAAQALEALQPFELLRKALSRRDQGPTPAEVGEFAESRQGDSSPEMQEFILLLQSLTQPMEARDPDLGATALP